MKKFNFLFFGPFSEGDPEMVLVYGLENKYLTLSFPSTPPQHTPPKKKTQKKKDDDTMGSMTNY